VAPWPEPGRSPGGVDEDAERLSGVGLLPLLMSLSEAHLVPLRSRSAPQPFPPWYSPGGALARGGPYGPGQGYTTGSARQLTQA
jgi:hypothetical protein